MRKYQFILWDADGTLLDFHTTEQKAFKYCIEYFSNTYTDALYARYHQFNDHLWHDFEKGIISKKQLMEIRFPRFFNQENIDIDGLAFEKMYRKMLGMYHDTMPYALEVLSHLSKYFDSYILTNGVSATQYQRLHASGIDQYIQNIFVSENVGAQKPNKKYFEYCFKHIPGFDIQKAIMIGDSLHSDMYGAKLIGLDTIYYKDTYDGNSPYVDHHITNLKQLYDILEIEYE